MRTGGIPPRITLRKYCLKGTGEQAGTILVERKLRQQVQFRQINLNSALPQLATFDFIFLRNVLLLLQPPDQAPGRVERVLSMLKGRAAGSSSATPKPCMSISNAVALQCDLPLIASVRSGTARMNRIKVMVVDDSAVARQVVVGLLQEDPGVEVIAAVSDPIFAMQRMQKQWPDVILLDVEMPRMDGITFLKQIMAERPTAVIICSTLTEAGAPTTLEALAAGAVTIITKAPRRTAAVPA